MQFGLAAQLAVGLLFLGAAFNKAWRPNRFIQGVRDYEILPDWVTPLFGVVVIAAELVLGLLHVAGFVIGVAAIAGTALFATFFVAVSISLYRGRVIDCHCDRGGVVVSAWVLLKLAVLIAFELSLVAMHSPNSTNWLIIRLVDGLDGLLLLAVAILLIELVTWLTQLGTVLRLAARLRFRLSET